MKYKLVKTSETHKGMDIMERKEVPVMCKECKDYIRQNGSSRCEHCSSRFRELLSGFIINKSTG